MKSSYYTLTSLGTFAILLAILVGLAFLVFGLVKTLSESFFNLFSSDVAGVSYEYGSNDCYLQGPDISKAVRVETRKFYITAYCPPETGYDPIEGGQMSSAGIPLAMGAVAVPPFNRSNPNIFGNTPDYPWGTTFEIPGYGRGIAVDHGCAIQKAGVPGTCKTEKWNKPTPYDHLDIFVGWGQEACKKWQTKSIDVKVYWFDPKVYNPKTPSKYIKRICRPSDATFISGGKILNVPCIGEDYPEQCGVASVCMVIAFSNGRCSATSQIAGSQTDPDLEGLLNKYTGISWGRVDQNINVAKATIDAGYPVIVYTGLYGKHIIVLTGYDQFGYFYYNNPLRGKKCIARQKKRWGDWGIYSGIRANKMIIPIKK